MPHHRGNGGGRPSRPVVMGVVMLVMVSRRCAASVLGIARLTPRPSSPHGVADGDGGGQVGLGTWKERQAVGPGLGLLLPPSSYPAPLRAAAAAPPAGLAAVPLVPAAGGDRLDRRARGLVEGLAVHRGSDLLGVGVVVRLVSFVDKGPPSWRPRAFFWPPPPPSGPENGT